MTSTIKDTVQVQDLRFQLYLSEKEIQQRIQELAHQIDIKLEGKRPYFIGILNGAFMFMSDLVRSCSIDIEMSFVRLKSYAATESTSAVQSIIGLSEKLEGRHIIIVEDIIDTGKTMHHFIPQLQTLQPASISLASLLFKPEALQYPTDIDYCGFEIPNKFVVGYGLDYNESGRNLRNIYQLIKE